MVNINLYQFTFNHFWRYVDIKIDGKQYKQQKIKRVRYEQNWTFEIPVGKVETHVIRIELIRSLFPVGLRECSAWVYIDGEKIREYSGKLSLRDKLFSGINLRNKMIVFLTTLIIMI